MVYKCPPRADPEQYVQLCHQVSGTELCHLEMSSTFCLMFPLGDNYS